MSPMRAALFSQTVGFLGAGTVAFLGFSSPHSELPVLAMIQAAFASLTSLKVGAERWWALIHMAFLPLAVTANRLEVPPFAWLSCFVLLFLVFWRTDKSQVPLYLTNSRTAATVAELLPPQPIRCIDVGCGTGSLLRVLAVSRPDSMFVGIEHAPIPFFVAWIRSLRTANLTIRYGDFWGESFHSYHVVYAFLSPAAMNQLWEKCCCEMTSNQLLISNSFPIESASPKCLVTVTDRRQSTLYCYTPNVKRIQNATSDRAFKDLTHGSSRVQ